MASPRIELGSGASETLILSIVLRGQFIYELRFGIYDLKTLQNRKSQILNRKWVHFPNFTILLPKIFTAMANNITPKNFLITDIPFGPKTFSIHFRDFNTM